MKYKVIEAHSTEDLEEKVNGSMEAGFTPLGGVQVVYATWENDRKGYSESETTFYQAMVFDR